MAMSDADVSRPRSSVVTRWGSSRALERRKEVTTMAKKKAAKKKKK
jgi:hypothetical protein